MRVSAILAAAAIGLTDARPQNDPFCPAFKKIVGEPSVSAQVDQLCSSVLGITTATRTVTSTVTPAPITKVVTSITTADTSTKTLTESTTDVSITTETTVLDAVKTTETSTSTSYSTIRCFDGTSVLSSYLLPTEAAHADKRNRVIAPVPTPSCLRSWKASPIKDACECLPLKRPTSTVTVASTKVARTVTSTSYSTVSPSTQTTTTVTVPSVTTTVTTITPDIETASATVTLVIETPALDGLDYYVYDNSRDYNVAGPGPNPANFQENNYYLSGVIQDVDTVSSYNGNLILPDGVVDADGIAIKFQGFFYAKTAGEYTFYTPDTIDNQLTVWVGDIAYGQQAWTYDNAAYDALRSGAGPYHGGQVTKTLRAGEVIPLTIIWGNSSGASNLYFWVSTPDGTTYYSTASMFTRQCPNGPFTRGV